MDNEKNKVNCQNQDCDDVESCDCQGICTCKSEINFEDAKDDCDDCCCDDDDDEDDDDDDDCDEFEDDCDIV